MGDFLLLIDESSVAPSLAWVTAALPNGDENVAYDTILEGVNGTPPYTFALLSGTLPTGLSITLVGSVWHLIGTPTLAGSFSPTIRLTDSGGSSPQDRTFQFTIVPVSTTFRITTTGIPNGQVDIAYPATTFQATGGVPPYGNWTVSSGTLPTGMTLNPSTGVLSGTPTQAGSFPITVSATDAVATSASSGTFDLVISQIQFAIQTTSLPAATVGTPYGVSPVVNLQATNGTTPYLWEISNKPAWMTLNTGTGGITGTPTGGATTLSLAVRVVDANTLEATATVTLRIFAAAGAEDRDAYFNELAADPDCVQSFYFNANSVVSNYFKQPPSLFWWVPGDPTTNAEWLALWNSATAGYSLPPGNYLAMCKPARREMLNYGFITSHSNGDWNSNVGDESVYIPPRLPLTRGGNQGFGVAGDTFVVTWDLWWSLALFDHAGPNPGGTAACDAWKTWSVFSGLAGAVEGSEWYCLEHNRIQGPWTGNNAAVTGLIAKPHHGPIGNLKVPIAERPPGFTGDWAQYYTPTNSPDYPLRDTLPVYHGRWSRYWLCVRLGVAGTNFPEWETTNATYFSANPSQLTAFRAGTWDMVTVAIADEVNAVRYEYYRVPTKRLAGQYVKTFRPNYDSSTKVKITNLNDGLSGPIFACWRNMVVMRNRTDDTIEFRKPVQ